MSDKWYETSLVGRRGNRNALRFRHRKATGHYKLEPHCPHDLAREPVLLERSQRNTALWKTTRQMLKPKQPAQNRVSETAAHRRARRDTSLAGRARFT